MRMRRMHDIARERGRGRRCRVTHRELLRIARRIYGRRAIVIENRKAGTREQREGDIFRAREIRTRLAEIDPDAAPRMLLASLRRLAAAARFVVDVDGDAPSIPELRPIVEDVDRRLALIDEGLALRGEAKLLHGHVYRWRVLTERGIFQYVKHEADTAEELAAEMEAAAAPAQKS